jgi:hypothetical protein
MKKVLSFLTVAIMAVAVFFTTQNVDQSANVTLSDMVKLNIANAECGHGSMSVDRAFCTLDGDCLYSIQGSYQCTIGG